MEKFTIWALFDSEVGSCAKALRDDHDVYSFGIGLGPYHRYLDLSDFGKAKKELDKYPKPDIIFASPPCETWVLMSVGQKRYYTKEKGYNLYWKDRFTPFDFTPNTKIRRLNGINTAKCTADIIKHYKPKLWAIENGRSSLIFDYFFHQLDLVGYRNHCNYYSYGLNVLKPTIIYSNLELMLKNEKPKKQLLLVIDISYKGKKENRLKYGNISKVPEGLYKDIIDQFSRSII